MDSDERQYLQRMSSSMIYGDGVIWYDPRIAFAFFENGQ